MTKKVQLRTFISQSAKGCPEDQNGKSGRKLKETKKNQVGNVLIFPTQE